MTRWRWRSETPRPETGVRFTCSRCKSQIEVWRKNPSAPYDGDHWVHHSSYPTQRPPPEGWLFEGAPSRAQRWWCLACAPPVLEWRETVAEWERRRAAVASCALFRTMPTWSKTLLEAWDRRNPVPRHPYAGLCP